MNKRTLKTQIKKKLESLNSLIDTINDSNIEPNDPETWDVDTLSELEIKLTKALDILNGKQIVGKVDQYGDPIILEEGLFYLIDSYQSEEEEEGDDE